MFRTRQRSTSYSLTIWSVILLAGAPILGAAQRRRPITPRDCVTVRYLAVDNSGQRAIQMNRQGTRAVYLVRSPRLETNDNLIEMYVVDLQSTQAPRLLLSGRDLSQIQWLKDGIHVVFLNRGEIHRSIFEVDTETGKVTPLLQFHEDIVEFSSDGTGASVAFATEVPSAAGGITRHLTPEDIASGYRIPFTSMERNGPHQRRIYIARRSSAGKFRIEPLTIRSPFSGVRLSSIPYVTTLHMSLSPNGEKLLVNYVDTTEQLPAAWRANPYVQDLRRVGFAGILPTILIDLKDRNTALALDSPWIANTPLWSPDGHSFVVYAESPIGTAWEKDDERQHRLGGAGAHLFSVGSPSGGVLEVAPTMIDISKQPLAWTEDGRLVLRTAAAAIGIFTMGPEGWRQTSSLKIPLRNPFRFSEIASNGREVVGDYQNAATPPEIFSFRSDRGEVSIIARLDPQFDHLSLANSKEIHWTTSTGYHVEGFLFVPPGYREGHLYPLVIQTKPYEGQFACDTGYNHYPSFAPQPIADAGMMYLVRSYPEDWKESDEVQHYPLGYPGGIGEAAFQMDVWDSAVRDLASRKVIDPDRVGIIGFSRTGWYTEFILTHSAIPYRAATLTDNAQYNLLEYWTLRAPSILRGWDAMYGGPPYGGTLSNWLDYSTSFHLEKVHAAVLMEEMGYGVTFDDKQKPPLNLSTKFDWFTGLNRLARPVELYYYPNEGHQPDHPKARLASLQRNLDWYSFWLKDRERDAPQVSEQYKRWERLRQQLCSKPGHSF